MNVMLNEINEQRNFQSLLFYVLASWSSHGEGFFDTCESKTLASLWLSCCSLRDVNSRKKNEKRVSWSAARQKPDTQLMSCSLHFNPRRIRSKRGKGKKLMQFTIVVNDSLHCFSNSKNDSWITLWHSSITDESNLRMPSNGFRSFN